MMSSSPTRLARRCGASAAAVLLLLAGACDRIYVFSVEGTVKDSVEVEPIAGIEITCTQVDGEGQGSATSADDGSYTCTVEDEAFAAKEAVDTISVTFEDTDGADNGGSFQSKTREVDVTDGETYHLNIALDPS